MENYRYDIGKPERIRSLTIECKGASSISAILFKREEADLWRAEEALTLPVALSVGLTRIEFEEAIEASVIDLLGVGLDQIITVTHNESNVTSPTFDNVTIAGSIYLPGGTIINLVSGRVQVNKNVLIQGPDGYNSSGEEAALFLGDSNVALRAVWGFGFKMNVAALADAMTVQEGTGDTALKGNLNLPTGKGYQIAGQQVLTDRQPPVSLPAAPTFSGPESAGYGWKTDTEMTDFMTHLSDLLTSLTAIRDTLIAHGQIEDAGE